MKTPLSFQNFSMEMVSLFKHFITTYNRTYETEEGEDPAWAVTVPSRSGLPPAWHLCVGRGRTEEVVHPFKEPSVPKLLLNLPGLGSHRKDLAPSPV